jgi:DNA repair and recombination protein RAD52
MVAFIEGFRAIDQANRLFGFGNWGGEVVGDIRYQQLHLGADPHEAIGMYWATVRVSVAGCEPRSDVGCGFASEATVEAHDTAIKAAVTDALKRALRQWGPQFGNSLYDRASPTRLSSARELSDLRSAVLALGAALGLDENSTRKHAAAKAGKQFNSLTPADLAGLLKVMAEAVTKRQKAA